MGFPLALLPSSHGFVAAAPAPPMHAAVLAETGALDAQGLELRFFPVCDFQRQSVAALFCTPIYAPAGAETLYGHRAFRDFTAPEWAAIDVAILEHALAFAARLAKAGIVVAVGASVSFVTLDDPSGRQHYRDALRSAHAREQAMLALKIEDIPEQAGGRRVAEIVSCVRPLVPRVFVHLPSSRMPLGGRELLHASGLVLSMPARLPLHGMQSEARWLARTAQLQSALACMDHVDTQMELETVRGAAIRFAAGHALNRPALTHDAELDEIRATLYGPALM
jgi:hypothetical protein